MKRGTAALETARHTAEQSMSGGGPWRFWLNGDKTKWKKDADGNPNNEAGIIILDRSLDDLVGFPEHNLKIAGKFGNFELCPKEWSHCPLCDAGDKGYYVVMCSILVLKSWTSKDGKKSGNCTKMLLPIKSQQMGKMEELFAAAIKKYGTLRGVFMYMKRDMHNANSPAIGEPSILDNASMFDFYTEDELTEQYGHAAELSPQGKVLKAQDEDISPFVYDDIFKKPDAKDLRARYGGKIQPGSAAEAEQEWGSEQEGEDELPGVADAPAAPSRPGGAVEQKRSAPPRRGAAAPSSGNKDPFAAEE